MTLEDVASLVLERRDQLLGEEVFLLLGAHAARAAQLGRLALDVRRLQGRPFARASCRRVMIASSRSSD